MLSSIKPKLLCKRLGNRLHCSGIDVGLFDAVGEKFQKVSFAVGMQKASEQISQISIGLQAVGFGAFYQREKRRTGLSTFGGAGKQPVLAAQHKWANGIFSDIVIRL
jgi:hypothetical protein